MKDSILLGRPSESCVLLTEGREYDGDPGTTVETDLYVERKYLYTEYRRLHSVLRSSNFSYP